MTDTTARGYLIDWYAILRIVPTATQEEIKESYRAMALDYHPDRYAHLAPEFAKQADERFRLATEANETLSNPERRRIYDEQRAAWTGPVSTTGHPIIDLGTRRFDPSRLFNTENAELGHGKIEEIANHLAPHDEATLSVVRMAMKAGSNDPVVLAAYRDVLRKKDMHLAIRESLLWDLLGDRNRPTVPALPDHVDGVEDALKELFSTAKEASAAYALCLIAVEPTPLLPRDETQKASAPQEVSLEALHDDALGRFNEVAGRIRTIATERQPVIQERFEIIDWRYAQDSPVNGHRVLCHCEMGKRKIWMSFALMGTTIATIDDARIKKDEQEIHEDDLKEAMTQGYSVIIARFEDDLDLKEQLFAVLLRHYAPFLPDDDGPEPS